MNIQKLLCLGLFLSLTTMTFAVNTNTVDVLSEFDNGTNEISAELSELEALNDLVISNGYTYETLQSNHTELATNANLSQMGIFDAQDESPLGIGGFWWGLVCGIFGLLIILIAEDKGSSRSEDVKNSLIGCLVTAALNGLYIAIAN